MGICLKMCCGSKKGPNLFGHPISRYHVRLIVFHGIQLFSFALFIIFVAVVVAVFVNVSVVVVVVVVESSFTLLEMNTFIKIWESCKILITESYDEKSRHKYNGGQAGI